MKRLLACAIEVLMGTMLAMGCASKPPAPSGFLEDYSRLSKADDGAMRYVSRQLGDYSSFMVDPVVIRRKSADSPMKPEDAAEVARYFNYSLGKVLADHGYQITDKPGVGTARVRVAVTDVTQSTWWLNLHPASKLSGAGAGGAAMEAEVIDSVTGEQLAAVIQAGKGNQFELDTFSSVDDVKDVIDKWSENAGKRLDELRGQNVAQR
jgi:hypothetical protein